MVKSGTNQQVGYILRSYPRLSQTFILNEMLALETAGVALQIFALSHPQEAVVQPQVEQIKAPVHYLAPPEQPVQTIKEHAAVFLRHPAGYLRALGYTLYKRVIDKGYTGSSRMACFRMAVTFANQLHTLAEIDHLHAHFAHDPTYIAQMAHWMTGIPYSFTTHARDLFQIPRSVLIDRVRDARFVVTCCTNNLKYLLDAAPGAREKFSMIYHGVNLQAFTPPAESIPQADVPLILSVGRLVEKKGFFDLLQALERVKSCGIAFRCLIYGDGPLKPALEEWIAAHDLSWCVSLAGSLNQQELVRVFQSATLFILTPSVTEDGDRDGIPNVLVEAMAVGLPVISTAAAGVPELITGGVNGLLFPPHDIEAIAGGMIALLSDAGKRQTLGQAGRETVLEHFNDATAAVRLKGLFATVRQPAALGEYFQANGPI